MVSPNGPSLEHIRFEGKSVSRSRFSKNHSIPPPSEIERGKLDPLIPWVLRLAGLPAGAYRAVPMRRRLSACLRALKVDSFSEARNALERRPKLREVAVSSLLIGVSEFFRDRDVFDVLQRIVVDDLADRKETLRIWSAGCSHGAELYSVAILLAEAGLLHRSVLVGTDCRPDAIRQARAGLYSPGSLQEIDASLLEKYFEAAEGPWRVAEPLRRSIQWIVQDFLASPEKGPWDVILWRNVAIYLESRPAEAVWKVLVSRLCPGGILVVGKAERPPVSVGLSYVSRSIYRRGPHSRSTGL